MKNPSQMKIYEVTEKDWEVPSFTYKEFFPRETKYCVCIPVINEGERIKAQLTKIRGIAGYADVIITDGGSTDGSLDEKNLTSNKVRTLLTKTGPGKLSAQMRCAMAYAIQEGYSGLIFIDGNNKDDPSAIPEFIKELEKGYDHVQGSRFVKGGKSMNTPLIRYLTLRNIHAPLISFAANYKYSDTSNGFRAYSRRMITDKRINPFRDIFSEYELHYYLAIRSARLGYKITEIPVTRIYPKNGKTPTKISPLKGNMKIFITLLKSCMRQYDPKD
jgi:dolichol-phosphate mannosyltransferase